MQPLKFAKLWLAAGIVMMFAVLALAISPGGLVRNPLLQDKSAHFAAFAFLMVWFSGVCRRELVPWVALGLMAYGALIEVVQAFLPYRLAEFNDALSDLAGILLGWALARVGLHRWAATVESWWAD